MQYEKDEILNDENVMETCEWLEYYDKYGKFPWEKKRVNIMLSLEKLEKAKKEAKAKKISMSKLIDSKL